MKAKRIIYLDIAKSIGIFMVIMVHSLPFFRATDNEAILQSIIGHIGVPLFAMTTGALVLSKSFKSKNDIFSFYKHNLLPIILISELWILFYFFNNHGDNFTFLKLFKNIFFIDKPEKHLWYIRMIIVYYLLMPGISYMLFNQKKLLLFFVISIFIGTFLYNLYLMLYKNQFYPTIPKYSYASYLIYFLAGFYISLSTKKYCILYMFLLFISFLTLFIFLKKSSFFIWYDNIFILFISIGLFGIIKEWGTKYLYWIEDISKMSFGIYLIHFFIITFLNPYIKVIPVNTNMHYWLLVITTILLCIIIIKITNLVPKLSYLLFRYK